MTLINLTDPANTTLADANLIANNNALIESVLNGGLKNDNFNAAANLVASLISGYPSDATKFLRGDGVWSTVVTASTRFYPRPRAFDGTTTANVWQTASTAVGFMFYLEARTSITNLYYGVATASGNVDIGIYDTSFNALWRYGSHAVGAASAVAPITVAISAGTPAATPLVLNPGYYYMVSAIDNTTANVASFVSPTNATQNRAGFSGVAALDTAPLWFTKAASFPLPATIASPTAAIYTTALRTLLIEGT